MSDVTESGLAGQPEPRQKVDKPVARSLMAFLESSEARAVLFVALLEDNKTGQPTDAEFDAAHDLLVQKPELLSKVAELARAAVDSTISRVSTPLLLWSADVLRSRDKGLENWANLADASPIVELRQLGNRLQNADKDAKSEAEHLLTIGIAVLIRRFDLDPIDALSELAAGRSVGQTKDAQRHDLKRVQKLLVKFRGQNLDNLIAVSRLFLVSLADGRAKVNQATATATDLRDRLQIARSQNEKQAAAISSLEAERSKLQNRLDDLEGAIVGVQGGADHAMIELRARYRRLLTHGIGTFLSNAHEALSVEPPAIGVVRSRVDLVRSKIAEELAWLNESLD